MIRLLLALLLGTAAAAHAQNYAVSGPNAATTNGAQAWTGQIRITGPNGGIDVDGDAISGSNNIGIMAESGVPSPVTGPAPAFFSAISGKSGNTLSAGYIAQNNSDGAGTDASFGIRRSRGFFGSETVAAIGTILGTWLMSDYDHGAGFTATYTQVWGKECYGAETRTDATHHGVSCKEFAVPNASGTLQIVDYVETDGTRQLPLGVLIGGAQSNVAGGIVSGPASGITEQVYSAAASTSAAVELVKWESNGTGAAPGTRAGGGNPNESHFLGRAQTSDAVTLTNGDIVSSVSNNSYLVEMHAIGRCQSGVGCATTEAIACVVRAYVHNGGGTATLLNSTADYCRTTLGGGVDGACAGTQCQIRAGAAACGSANQICATLVSNAANQVVSWDIVMDAFRIQQ